MINRRLKQAAALGAEAPRQPVAGTRIRRVPTRIRLGMIDTSKRRLKQSAALASILLHHSGIAGDIAGALLRGQFETARHMARTLARTPDIRAEKIISRKYRYLWVCNPKVASRSIIAALCSGDPDAEIVKNRSVSEVYSLYPEVSDYFSFAFIRHPFDRALSLYSEIHLSPESYQGAQRQHKREKRQTFFDSCYGLAEASSFDAYCRWLNTPFGSDACAEKHFLSQHLQIRRDDGRLPDFIGRLENLDEDLQQVAIKVGMPPPEPPMLNTMSGWQVEQPEALETARRAMRAHLTERNRALLSTRYAADLELGGYPAG